ncbi:MAG: hypothetical protein HC876_16660 [Chloroflexaceae bacterium]|nr:hypothetical protein [Chloroflexaceae bacterium]NJO07012.1 hypothetical protein [Chloroflexaceae bacterium]
MLEFYRTRDCEACAEIRQILADMVVSHRLITVEAGQPVLGLPAGTVPPVLKDADRVVVGGPAIAAYLSDLAALVNEWRYTSNCSCSLFIDDE